MPVFVASTSMSPHAIKKMFPLLIQLTKQEGLPIHQGEPETPFIKQFHPTIFQMNGISEVYDFMRRTAKKIPKS